MSRTCTARTTTTSPNPASRVWRGPCARRSRSIRGAGTRSLRPRARSAAVLNDHRHCRLRLGQSALGRQSLRTGGGGERDCGRDPGDAEPRDPRRRRPRRPSRRRRLWRLPPRARRRARSRNGAEGGGARPRPAVSRHLRRHATDGRARARVRDHRRPRLDRRRGRTDHARRSRAQDPAYGLERHNDRRDAPALRRHSFGRSRLFRAQLSFPSCRPGRPRRLCRLRRPPCSGDCARQSRRHAVSPGKEPKSGAAADRQFLAVASMSSAHAAGTIAVERLTQFSGTDLDDLCEATESAILEGGGFGWLKPPPRQVLENYWKGVLLVPERRLVVGRLDGVIAGSAQLSRAPRNNEAQAFAGQLTSAFVAPWARGRGLGRGIVREVERLAREMGLMVLNLDLRDTQRAAISLYESMNYRRWGTHPVYARVEGRVVPGHYYYKILDEGLFEQRSEAP